MAPSTSEEIPSPVVTSLALDWLECEDARLDRAQRAFLLTVNGRRNLVQLESVARALGMRDDALLKLRKQGLIEIR